MNKSQGEEILQELDDFDAYLARLGDNYDADTYRIANHLVQIARPFLKTLVDIAQSLESINNK